MSKALVPENKRERGLVSSAKATVRNNIKKESRVARMLGATTVVSTIALDKKIAPMVPSIPTPLGNFKATGFAGALGLLGYVAVKDPGVVMTSVGMGSIVLLSRAV